MALRPSSELWNHFNNIEEEGMAECKLCKQRLRNNRSYNLKLHLKKVHRNRDEINKYFTINVVENLATCKTCKQCLKNRLCNLRLHMRRSHQIEINLPDENSLGQPPSPQPYDEEQIRAVLNVAKRKMNDWKQVGNAEKRPKRNLYLRIDKKTIVRSVIGLIVEDGLSTHLFSSEHIEALLSPMCEAISDKEGREFKLDEAELEKIINLMANYIRNDFSNDLHWRLLSIKIDTDIDALPKTFCVSAQFCSDGEIQMRMLGIINLKDEEQLEEDHIKQILYKFNIDSSQVISVFWDNSKQKNKHDVENCKYLNEIEQFESYPVLFLGDNKIERYVGAAAQLSLLQIFKNSTILKHFLECRNFVKYISNETNGYFGQFEQSSLRIPQLDSPWISGSTYKMMHDLHDARKILENFKFEDHANENDHFNVTDELWSFIEAFCSSLSYLQKSILKFSTEELHIGDFYGQWLKSKIFTEKMINANNKEDSFSSIILSEVLKTMETKSNELLNQDRFAACIYLDPRFQRTLKTEQKAIAVEYLKKMWSRAKLYIVDDTENIESSAQLFDDDEDAFLNEFLSHDIQVKDTKTNNVYQKIEELKLTFQVVDTDVLSYWQGQKTSEPELHALSTICFAIPATDIYNKTRYSHIYRLDSNSELSTFTKENLLNIRLNVHLLNDVLSHLQLFTEIRSNSSTLSAAENEIYDISEDDNSNTGSNLTTYSGVGLGSSTTRLQVSSTPVSSAELSVNEFL